MLLCRFVNVGKRNYRLFKCKFRIWWIFWKRYKSPRICRLDRRVDIYVSMNNSSTYLSRRTQHIHTHMHLKFVNANESWSLCSRWNWRLCDARSICAKVTCAFLCARSRAMEALEMLFLFFDMAVTVTHMKLYKNFVRYRNIDFGYASRGVLIATTPMLHTMEYFRSMRSLRLISDHLNQLLGAVRNMSSSSW